jgi:hypothetical protein
MPTKSTPPVRAKKAASPTSKAKVAPRAKAKTSTASRARKKAASPVVPTQPTAVPEWVDAEPQPNPGPGWPQQGAVAAPPVKLCSHCNAQAETFDAKCPHCHQKYGQKTGIGRMIQRAGGIFRRRQ